MSERPAVLQDAFFFLVSSIEHIYFFPCSIGHIFFFLYRTHIAAAAAGVGGDDVRASSGSAGRCLILF